MDRPGMFEEKTQAARGVLIVIAGSLICTAIVIIMIVGVCWLMSRGVEVEAMLFAALGFAVAGGCYSYRGTPVDQRWYRLVGSIALILAVAAVWPR